MSGKFTDWNDTPAESARPGTIFHMLVLVRVERVRVDPRDVVRVPHVPVREVVRLDAGSRSGAPHLAVRLDISVAVIAVMPRCLEFSGWV